MGLTYYFKFRAPDSVDAAQLETFLQRVEKQAKKMGFGPTMVLNAQFNTPERRNFSKRLTHGMEIANDALKGGASLRDGQVWEHDFENGRCRVIPTQAVVLIVTDEKGCESVFGFYKYPALLLAPNDSAIAKTGLSEDWFSQDFIDSPDPRYRKIVTLFKKAGFVEQERDDFGVAAASNPKNGK
jgi:hypothetical protein